ncbi:MAG: sugar phosphate isomerase/epimerase [Clostridia bacterium]|nr:sugar phosphate isomerase/epimerase [Clostridia bacterium]
MNKLGVMINVNAETNFTEKFQEAREMGLCSCQLSIWNPALYTDENAAAINRAKEETGLEVSLLWAGYTGPCEWNFTAGPETIGLVPVAFRGMRLEQLAAASDFAEKIGVSDIATHVGFIPENPSDQNYRALIASLRWLCNVYKSRGQNFLFETGQETPVTVLRAIEDIGTGNTYINFDTANLILYGKANSADAVRVFGKYIRNTHIKDGFYPTDGKNLGREVKVGEGLANLPAVISLLRECGYEGPYTIEREISGEQQKKDIADTITYLNTILQ